MTFVVIVSLGRVRRGAKRLNKRTRKAIARLIRRLFT